MADDSADFQAAPHQLLTSLRSQTINLAAGPSSLPTPVLLKATAGLLDYAGTGIGLTELSHRSSTFMNLCKKTESDLRSLLAIPEDFAVLFLQGGGLTQFSMTALNLLAWYRIHNQDQGDVTAEYIVTGSWSAKAAGEAKRLGIAPHVVTDSRILSEDKKSFGSVAPESDWTWSSPNDKKPAYIYYCANETVNGVEIAPPSSVPSHLRGVPIVADMSSNILSKPIPWKEHNFGIVYAGAQKNIGPAGLTLVFIRKDLLVDTDEALPFNGPRIPAMLSYKNLADNDSLYNTPPMFCIYVAGLVFEHLLELGGVDAIDSINEEKAKRVYQVIDASQGFYVSKVQKGYRSRMNIVFVMGGGVDQEKRFLAEAEKVNIKQIKGHRSVGGIRTSLYNAIELEAVNKLVAFMTYFMQKEKEIEKYA